MNPGMAQLTHAHPIVNTILSIKKAIKKLLLLTLLSLTILY